MQASARLSSSAAFRKVIAGVSSATTRSCYRTSRGKAHAAPLPAQEPPTQKGRKRLTNQERRLRVLEFVESYRASNDGKYPTVQSICQEIRSGHHTVRPILQEIKYHDGKLAPDKSKAAEIQVIVKVIDQPRPKDEPRVAENQERRLRVMEFVESYRASNDGKYPTVQSICKEVRSGPHTVRPILQEIKYHDGKLAPDKSKAEVIDQPRPKDEPRVAENRVIPELPDHSMPKDDAKDEPRVAENRVIPELPDHSMPNDDAKVAQLQGPVQVPDHSFPMDEDAPGLSDQTERERMKGLTDNPDPGNQQREIEANKLDLKNSEKTLSAKDSNGSEETGSNMMNEAAKTHAREDNPKLEESPDTGLLGSLKSFAYGIKKFWNNM